MAPQLEEMLNQQNFLKNAPALHARLSSLATELGAAVTVPKRGWEQGQSFEITKGNGFFRFTVQGPDTLGGQAKLERAWGFFIETSLGHRLWLVLSQDGWRTTNEVAISQSLIGQFGRPLVGQHAETAWKAVADPFKWLEPSIREILG